MAFDDGFNTRWLEHSEFQSTNDINEQQFFLKTGWTPSALEGKVVLDAGCGCGRFSFVASKYAAKVIALDASPAAVESARKNCPEIVDVRQCNLLESLPVANESVDMAFSLGVLHHTGNTKKAFMNVASTVKPQGELAVWVYHQPAPMPLMPMVDMLHEITRAVPPAILHGICKKYATKIRDLYRSNQYGTVEHVLKVSQSSDDDECISDTFDWHTPQYRDWHSVRDVRDWFILAGFVVDQVGTFPVSLTGHKVASKFTTT